MRERVAPHAGARIETMTGQPIHAPPMSLPTRERGSKRIRASESAGAEGRSPRGSADRNFRLAAHQNGLARRSPRGSADRNDGSNDGTNWTTLVAPHAGARIETTRPKRALAVAVVAPHAGARIETSTRDK